MEIEFEMDKDDKQKVRVIGIDKDIRKQIGSIFTPSSSGHDTKNAIQVCGIDEAFDLWGCSKYKTYKTDVSGHSYMYEEPKTFQLPYRLLEAFDSETMNKIIKITRESYVEERKKVQGKKVTVQLKDIQLKFPYPSESLNTDWEDAGKCIDNCWGCFNKPCTCENKGKHTYTSPYDLKSHRDLHLEMVKKEEKKNN